MNNDTAKQLELPFEEWKPIPEFEGFYEISNLGIVKRIAAGPHTRPGRLLKGSPKKSGYIEMGLRKKGLPKRFFLLHILVAKAFVAGYSEGLEVNHINGNKHDNAASNLEWVTKVKNIQHRINVLGIHIERSGEQNYCAKLKNVDIPVIREMYSTGTYSYKKLGKLFNVSGGAIQNIILGKTWRTI